MNEQMRKEFDDFMQDMYDEEELQYMDSGFVGALFLAFGQGWQASRKSLVVKLPVKRGLLFCATISKNELTASYD